MPVDGLKCPPDKKNRKEIKFEMNNQSKRTISQRNSVAKSGTFTIKDSPS